MFFPNRLSLSLGIIPPPLSVSLVRDPRGPAQLLHIREEYLDTGVRLGRSVKRTVLSEGSLDPWGRQSRHVSGRVEQR